MEHRFLWLLGGLILFIVVGLLALPWLLPRPDVPDIPNPGAWPMPEPNGCALALQAAREMTDAGADVLKARPSPAEAPPPAVAEYVAENERALATLDRAFAAEGWARPQPVNAMEEVPALASLRDLARLKGWQAAVRSHQGDYPGALAASLDSVRLGNRAQHARLPVSGWLVGVALRSIGLANLQALLGPPPAGLSPQQQDPTRAWPLPALSPADRAALLAAMDTLARLRPSSAGLAETLAVEHHDLARSLRGPNATGAAATLGDADPAPRGLFARVPRFVYDPKRTVDLSAVLTAELVTLAQQPRPERDWTRYRAQVARLPDDNSFIYNAVGKHAVATSVQLWEKLVDMNDAAQAHHDFTRTALALRLYADDHGRLPEALGALVEAGHLDAVPTDPFSGGPLRYRPREGLIYSVGPNGRDDGGRLEQGRSNLDVDPARPDDIAVQLAFVGRPTEER